MTSTTTPTPPAYQFRQKHAPPPLPKLDELLAALKSRREKGEQLDHFQDVTARRSLMGGLDLLGSKVPLPQVPLPPGLSDYQASRVRRRLEPVLPSYNELFDQFSDALAKAPKPLSKAIDGSVRQSLAAILSMLILKVKNSELEVVAAANGRAAQAQADADARERAAFAESQRARVREAQIAKLTSEQAEYEKQAALASEA